MRVAAGQFDALPAWLKLQPVEDGQRVHDCLKFVKAVGPFPQNVEQEIDFAER
jgi:hypothetical protein